MKIGIVSDIHADAPALRRALEHMPSADIYLCPGDAVSEYRSVQILSKSCNKQTSSVSKAITNKCCLMDATLPISKVSRDLCA